MHRQYSTTLHPTTVRSLRAEMGLEVPRTLSEAAVAGDAHTLASWGARYVAEVVHGRQSPHTLEAKRRDLSDFIQWFVAAKGHGRIEGWHVDDTRMYLARLRELGRAVSTINRALASLRHFARWVHEQPGGIFRRHGLPTHGIAALQHARIPTTPLTQDEILALNRASIALLHRPPRKNARPWRNRAVFLLLLHAPYRVSELLRYPLVEWPLNHQARPPPQPLGAAVEHYLNRERPLDDPEGHARELFLSAGKRRAPLTRQQVANILVELATWTQDQSGVTIRLSSDRLRRSSLSDSQLLHDATLSGFSSFGVSARNTFSPVSSINALQ